VDAKSNILRGRMLNLEPKKVKNVRPLASPQVKTGEVKVHLIFYLYLVEAMKDPILNIFHTSSEADFAITISQVY